MAKKLETNEDLINNIMQFSNFGALSQMFVIDALTKHANRVASAIPEDFNPNGLVAPEAWIGVAKEIKDKMDAFYKRKNG